MTPEQRLAEVLHKHDIGCKWRKEDHRLAPTGWVDDADHEAAARDIIEALEPLLPQRRWGSVMKHRSAA